MKEYISNLALKDETSYLYRVDGVDGPHETERN